MKRQHDISMHANTYTNQLIEHMDSINKTFNNCSTDVNTLKQVVIESIKTANETNAKRKFVSRILSQKTKDDILFTIYNATMAGCGESVI